MLPHQDLHALFEQRLGSPRLRGNSKRPLCARIEGRRTAAQWRMLHVIASTQFRRLAGLALGIVVLGLPAMLPAQGATPDAGSTPPVPHRMSWRASRHPATISPRAMPATARCRRRRRLLPRRAADAIRRTPSCSSARSSPCWSKARSTRRSGSPSACSQRQERSHRAARARRARAQAEAISGGAPELAQSVRGPITDLTATLLTAWAMHGAGDTKGAIDGIDKLHRRRNGTRSSRTCMPA